MAHIGPLSLFAGIAALSFPFAAKAADNAPASSVKVALLSMKTNFGEFKLGGPVVVSRQDIESPLARVRSPELNMQIDSGAKASDPVFKGVYLTPREYTGRPSLLPPIPAEEPPPPAEPAAKPGTFSTASVDPVAAPPAAPPEKAAPPNLALGTPTDTGKGKNKGNSPSTGKPSAGTPQQSAKARQPKQAAKAAGSPAAGRSKPEIEATRAFSRM